MLGGWPIVCGLILLVAVSMSELVSKYPTAGGIYYWASDLGGKTWGWFTGWFNLIGLVGVTASVVYASAQFAYYLLSLYGLDIGFMNFGDRVRMQAVVPAAPEGTAGPFGVIDQRVVRGGTGAAAPGA